MNSKSSTGLIQAIHDIYTVKCFLLLFIIIFPLKGKAQKEAYHWIWGICNDSAGNCPPLYGTSIIKFNDDSIDHIYSRHFPGKFTKGTASISDASGNFFIGF